MTTTHLLPTAPPRVRLSSPLLPPFSRTPWPHTSVERAPPPLHLPNPVPTPPAAGTSLKVFVVAPAQPILRAGLATILASDPGCKWVGEACSCRQAADEAPALMPDVVLVDADAEGPDLAAALVPLQARLPLTRLVLLASERQPSAVPPFGLPPAVSARVPRDVDASALVRALRAAPAAAPAFALGGAATAPRMLAAADLTPREITLLGLMGEGLSNAGISSRLGIALPTVKFHVTNILSKMQTKNRTAAVLEALRLKLIDLDA
jgi:NarL family two-component system response regulator LiaR